MTDLPEPDGHSDVDQNLQRSHVLSARHHVGAAGFAHTEALERIVSAGREPIALAQSIRQVVATTQSQLRDLALELDPEGGQVQIATLEEVVSSNPFGLRGENPGGSPHLHRACA